MDLIFEIRKKIPKGLKYVVARNLFGMIPDSSRKMGEAMSHNRIVIAARYLVGSGVEIGALGSALPVPKRLRVQYVDRFDESGLTSNFPEVAGRRIQRPDIVDDAETLKTVKDGSQDFLIANHVIEHLPNPLLFLKNAVRVLKRQGILYIAIPNKCKTFDSERPVTTFDHLMGDYVNGPDASRQSHFEEYVLLADNHNARRAWSNKSEYKQLVEKLMNEDYSIHYHVWDTPAMIEMFLRANEALQLNLFPEAMVATGNETVFVWRKS